VKKLVGIGLSEMTTIYEGAAKALAARITCMGAYTTNTPQHFWTQSLENAIEYAKSSCIVKLTYYLYTRG
jgi:hypothetical protein